MTDLVAAILVFVAVGAGFLLANLVVGRLIRPNRPDPEKGAIYECGEPTVGSAWVQFDLRFYVVALLFVVFDVEVALLFPWALVFGQVNTLADPNLPAGRRAEIAGQLVANVPTGTPEAGTPEAASVAAAAQGLGWWVFGDLLVFFGVLLVGFAYLWRRGDLDWVRSVAAQRAAGAPPDDVPTRIAV
jgi:NADH-quinone oxidoreductase subunit A